jgi:hypothetical protein
MLPNVLDRAVSSPHDKMFPHAGNSTTGDTSLIMDVPIHSQQ